MNNDVISKLKSLGVVVLDDWVNQCIAYLLSAGTVSASTPAAAVCDAVMRVYLDTDIYISADEINMIPDNMEELHMVQLFTEHPRVLQIDEVVDVGASSQRSQQAEAAVPEEEDEGAHKPQVSAHGKHLLKVFLTDGVHQTVGLDLYGVLAATFQMAQGRLRAGADAPSMQAFFAGAKVVLSRALVRRGAFVLTHDSCRLLGGTVPRLQALCTNPSSTVSTATVSAAPGQVAAVPAAARAAPTASLLPPAPAIATSAAPPAYTLHSNSMHPSRVSAPLINLPTVEARAVVSSASSPPPAPRPEQREPVAMSTILQPAVNPLLSARPPPLGVSSTLAVSSPIAPVLTSSEVRRDQAAPQAVPSVSHSTALTAPPAAPISAVPPSPPHSGSIGSGGWYASEPMDDGNSFYDDVPLTCDISLSEGEGGGEDADQNENSGSSPAGATSHSDSGRHMEVQFEDEQPCNEEFSPVAGMLGCPGNSQSREGASEVPPLQYWDQLAPDWNGAGDAGGAHESFARVRGFTSRVLRLKTVVAAASSSSSSEGKRQFDVAVEIDDGHNEVACQVSNDLVERFLDMSAADYHALLEQLRDDKAARKEAQRGLTSRFADFHGLFWVYPRPPGEVEAGAGAGGAGAAQGKKSKSKKGQEGAAEPVERMILIDFAADDVRQLCATMLQRRRQNAT